ncbi:NAD(P)-dependent dehydrogenase (short-subunit alcohol dehydrogenase family) [Mycobacterium sp. OTB74]|jgi:NAD(P)-dependent dehydrogenase (short-subunit alcohol dehydrogenase family)|nr:NAD(P)-dependent dehydrogenase (short-subunit alcohol dehydrogenase family) [Mycobacterium sp. OTB74]
MGYQAAQRLRDHGHTVIGVDLKDADVIADLSTAAGRRTAGDEVLRLSDHRLDGAVLAAGIGPGDGADRPRLIAQINFFGVVELLSAWRPALAATGHAKVVAIGSNSTTTTPVVPRRTIGALLAGDADKATRSVQLFGSGASAIMYAASKIALSRWVRRNAVTPEWAGSGIRLNALAPGAILTPLLQAQLDSPREGKAVRNFPIPSGGFGDPGQLADWIIFMLSDAAEFLCGSIIFVDGGTDAYFRPDGWPKAVPLRGVPRYLWKFLRYGKTR